MSGYVTRLLALSVAVTALAALAWAEPAHALHELECPAFQGTHIDPATGKQRCGALSNETRKQAVRVRRLLQEQRRRTQTSPEVQRQRNRPRLLLQEQQRRTRDLEVQRTIRTKAQARITDLEIGRQKQAILRNAGKRKQPAIDRPAGGLEPPGGRGKAAPGAFAAQRPGASAQPFGAGNQAREDGPPG